MEPTYIVLEVKLNGDDTPRVDIAETCRRVLAGDLSEVTSAQPAREDYMPGTRVVPVGIRVLA